MQCKPNFKQYALDNGKNTIFVFGGKDKRGAITSEIL